MGIDYGRGLTNIDHATGIRYGVTSIYPVIQAWSDSSEPHYPDNDAGEEIDDFSEPTCFFYNKEGYKAEQSTDDATIWVIKSPFYTLTDYCSPCAPGAGDLQSTGEVKTYCFGHDWYDSGRAPYPVYSVETGELINE